MRHVVYQLEGPNRLVEIEQDPLALAVTDTGLVAHTRYTAVSPGTELAAWEGKPPLRPSKVYPRLLGYCNLAQVVQAGVAVHDVSVGDFILTHQAHRSAFVCDQEDVLFHFKPTDDEEFSKKITGTYLYHLGYSAVLASEFRPGHTVAVVGLGTIGLAIAGLLTAFGARPQLFTDQASSFSRLKDRGFEVFAKSAAALSGADIVINTSNKWSDHALSMRLSRKGGTIVCVGFPGRGEAAPDHNPLDSQYFYDKQLTFKHCGHVSQLDLAPGEVGFTLKRNMRYLVSLIEAGKINPLDILTTETSWDKLDQTYRYLATRPPGVYSALIRWSR